ncbi:MAG: energy transducer TonB [Planctomycetes bacterium]|nr:energy transducer TonB [Planctomycetota bacterium]
MFRKYHHIAIATSVSVHLLIGVTGYGMGLFEREEYPAQIMMESGESVMIMDVSAPESIRQESAESLRRDEQREQEASHESLCRKLITQPDDLLELDRLVPDMFAESLACPSRTQKHKPQMLDRKLRDISTPDVPEQIDEIPDEGERKISPESSGSTGDLREKGVQSECVITHCPRPEYPEISRKRGEEGSSAFTITVSKTGKLINIALSKSSGYHRLDKAARGALVAARFEPAVSGGRHVDSSKTIIITFRLDEL